MKKYDVVRKELVDTYTDDSGLCKCYDTNEVCYSSEVVWDFINMDKHEFIYKYAVSEGAYNKLKQVLPRADALAIDDRIGYKDEDRIRDIAQWDEGIQLSELNISKEDREAIRRARKHNKKDYDF